MERIIDEVDVSGCEHLKKDDIKKPICRSGGCRRVYRSCLCDENIDCHYRQLKRLEAENAKLKEKYQEELIVSTQLREWQDEDLRQIKELTVERNRLFGENAILLEENAKLKEALKEIREIDTTCLEFKTCENCKFLKICSNMGTESYIVNKIDEVLKDDEN